MTDSSKLSVTIIVPCFNEIKHIEGFLKSALAQESIPNGDILEILVADGMSDDGTRDKIKEIASHHSQVRMIDNPKRIAAAALNLAIKAAKGEVIVRMDAHTEYATDYVKRCLEVLVRTGADNVGGPARTKANGYIQSANRLAFHSPFSVGGAKFHNEEYIGYVDTVTYGCWRKQFLEEIGLFDETFIRDEDDELNLRIIRKGGSIWQSTNIRSWYYPRGTLRGLFAQYVQYGYWKVRVIKKHRAPASIRHLVPFFALTILLILAALAPLHSLSAKILVGILGLYALTNLFASIIACLAASRVKYLPVMPLVFATYHFAYAYGFLRGLFALTCSHLTVKEKGQWFTGRG